MKLRLFRRRLTVSSPRMAIRSSMPWPVLWIGVALMLGFSAAVALWAFEVGKGLAGLDSSSVAELSQLRAEVQALRLERESARSVANTSDSLLTAEKAAQQKMVAHLKQLELDNRKLRDDLGFFEKLLPAGGNESASIRGLQAEMLSEMQVKWQALVIQPAKDAPNFNGKLELTFNGTLNGKPWMTTLPGGPQALQFKQYRRLGGVLDLPPQAVIKTVTAKVLEGATVRSIQTVTL